MTESEIDEFRALGRILINLYGGHVVICEEDGGERYPNNSNERCIMNRWLDLRDRVQSRDPIVGLAGW